MPKRRSIQVNYEMLAAIIRESGRTAASVSAMLGKHERWLSNVKNGRNLPTVSEACSLCQILGVKPDTFVVGESNIRDVNAAIDLRFITDYGSVGLLEQKILAYNTRLPSEKTLVLAKRIDLLSDYDFALINDIVDLMLRRLEPKRDYNQTTLFETESDDDAKDESAQDDTEKV